MVQGFEKRLFPRVDARINVQFRSGPEYIACYTKNLSQGGIFLETLTPPDPNARIEIVLDVSKTLRDESISEIRVFGRVVRVMTVSLEGEMSHKVAVQFVDMTTAVEIQLTQLFQKLERPSA